MKAAVYMGPGNMEITDVPDPHPGKGDMVLKVECAAVCGTDVRIYRNGHKMIPAGTRRILGHEIAGTIVEVGDEVDGYLPGERVTVAPNFFCGACEMCARGATHHCTRYGAGLGIIADGGFATHVLIPAVAVRTGNVINIPDEMTFEEAALIEPLSCVYNGLSLLSVGATDVVLIFGAGPIGLMHAALVKVAGARLVIVADIVDARLEVARALGADCTVNPLNHDIVERVRELTEGHGADVVITACGSAEAQAQALEVAAVFGRVSFFAGLPGGGKCEVDTNLIHYKQLMVTGSTRSTNHHFRVCMDLAARKRLDLASLVSSRVPLAELMSALDATARSGGLKTLVYPSW